MNSLVLLGMVGPWQVIVIVAILLLFFGGKKIPELMKGLGRGVREFKEGINPEEEETDQKDKEKK